MAALRVKMAQVEWSDGTRLHTNVRGDLIEPPTGEESRLLQLEAVVPESVTMATLDEQQTTLEITYESERGVTPQV